MRICSSFHRLVYCISKLFLSVFCIEAGTALCFAYEDRLNLLNMKKQDLLTGACVIVFHSFNDHKRPFLLCVEDPQVSNIMCTPSQLFSVIICETLVRSNFGVNVFFGISLTWTLT